MNKLSQPGSLLQFFSFTDGVGPILSAPLFWRKRCLFEVLRKCACRRGSSCIPISTDFSWCLDPFFFPILSVTGHLPLVSSTAFSPCQACLPQHTIPLDKLITFFRFRYILGFLTEVPLCSIFTSQSPDVGPWTNWTKHPLYNQKTTSIFLNRFGFPTGFWPPLASALAIRSQPTKSCAALTCDSSNGLKVIAERNVGDP